MSLDSLTFVTGSAAKHAEAERILGAPLRRVALDLPETQEIRVAAVVEAKALAAWEALGRTPVLVEDTGLAFDAWDGLPGALVKWFVGSVGVDGICRMLDGFASRAATATTVVAVYDGTLRTFEGSVRGHVAPRPAGSGGFGWDSIFIPDGAERTYAEMDAAEKDRHSMRPLAFAAAAAALHPPRGGVGCPRVRLRNILGR
jgi:non-canonical purine NTP pyrophosphatase (RdgB/HAM1 family)